jgi:UDP-N-acetylmuramoyl-tripeptide--D-alanyl-D-alanine ligase
MLDDSLAVGRRFLLNSQRAEGNFHYRYDFLARKDSEADMSVRQAGVLWGLALIHQDEPSAETAAAVARGLRFFVHHSRRTPDGGRLIAYPGDEAGSTGAVALVCLALVEMFRTDLQAPLRERYRRELDEYLRFLLSLRRPDGQFHSDYDLHSGTGSGVPSPYYDGESLLALVKAARYAGRADLQKAALGSAERMHQANVVRAQETHLDSDITKGFYQWGTMAYFELYTSGWPGTEIYASRAISLAHWMIDVHRTLLRRRNTGYAYEGLVSAWELARLTADRHSQERIGAVIARGLKKLTSWQVGGPTPNGYLRKHPTNDPRAVGGVMNAEDDPRLRVDVTQHQMHAVILARRYVYKR